MILRGRGGRSAKKCTVLHSTEGPFAVLHDHGVAQTDLQYRGCPLTCGAFQGRPPVPVVGAGSLHVETLIRVQQGSLSDLLLIIDRLLKVGYWISERVILDTYPDKSTKHYE